jgi:hypothetical protein
LALAMIIGGLGVPVAMPITVAMLILLAQLAQLVLVRPGLTRRTNAVLAGAGVPRSRAHLAYVLLELIKVIALLVGGMGLLVG